MDALRSVNLGKIAAMILIVVSALLFVFGGVYSFDSGLDRDDFRSARESLKTARTNYDNSEMRNIEERIRDEYGIKVSIKDLFNKTGKMIDALQNDSFTLLELNSFFSTYSYILYLNDEVSSSVPIYGLNASSTYGGSASDIDYKPVFDIVGILGIVFFVCALAAAVISGILVYKGKVGGSLLYTIIVVIMFVVLFVFIFMLNESEVAGHLDDFKISVSCIIAVLLSVAASVAYSMLGGADDVNGIGLAFSKNGSGQSFSGGYQGGTYGGGAPGASGMNSAATLFCPQCGSQAPLGTSFCPKCGARIQ